MNYIILNLFGPMQSWGSQTYEDYRPSYNFPTKSAIAGIISACLGIRRTEFQRLKDLHDSISIAIKTIQTPVKSIDFQTIEGAFKADGKMRKARIISHKEYLCDGKFIAAVQVSKNGPFSVESIIAALNEPFFTPYLGRKCCALSSPLFNSVIAANSIEEALCQVCPEAGTIYSEVKTKDNAVALPVRDVVTAGNGHMFHKRSVFMYEA